MPAVWITYCKTDIVVRRNSRKSYKFEQPIKVISPIGGAGHVAVAEQIIESIGIELTGDQFDRERRLQLLRIEISYIHEQPIAIKDRVHIGIGVVDDVDSPLLMVLVEHPFKQM